MTTTFAQIAAELDTFITDLVGINHVATLDFEFIRDDVARIAAEAGSVDDHDLVNIVTKVDELKKSHPRTLELPEKLERLFAELLESNKELFVGLPIMK